MIIKRIIYGFFIFLLAILLVVGIYFNSLLPIITGYAAKNLCSAVFVSGRKPLNIEAIDLNFSFIKFTKNRVNYVERSVTSRFLWGSSKAIYRDGFGVTLLRDIEEETLREMKFPAGTRPGYSRDTIPWPLGDMISETDPAGIDKTELDKITKMIMADTGYNGNAFAFMVLHKGIPVAEAYKPEFDHSTRFLSWSMAKSFTNALVGILAGQGRMKIEAPAGIKEWAGDERNSITLNDLMQMQSGLKWNEDYGNRSDVTLMLHCKSDMAKYAYERPVAYPAGTHWYYSSGTTNIITYLIRQQFGNDDMYYSFVYNELFNRIGMPDAVFEADPAGTLVGSSYLYATARDYARFALLFQGDGVFNGERILPEGWVDYTKSEASGSSGEYGALFWLNKGKKLPSVPEDMYMCVGHDGQRIFIIPSEQIIVVVLGYSPQSNGGMDFDRLLKDILDTLN